MKLALIIVAAVFVQLVDAGDADAYKLEPISRVFAPSGSNSSQSFELTNSSSERVAVMISFATLELDADHKESNRPADDDFLVYPAQILLPPNGRQTVRVTWLGSPTPASELAYRIIAQQVPIELLDKTARPTPTGQLKVLVTYRGSLYIRPAAAAPRIVADSATVVEDAGRARLVVTLRNAGSAVGLLKSCSLRVQTASAAFDVPVANMSEMTNSRILARHVRRYRLPWPATLPAGALKVSGTCNSITP
jgi:fimbrial chaperone protein